MFTYPIYKQLKQRLNTVAPGFWYTGQYAKAKGNTVYRVPAIYIEMPKGNNTTYWGRGIRCVRNAIVKVHYISNAPFHQHDNTVQESALVAHQKALVDINDILEGLVLKNEHGRILTQQFKLSGSSEFSFAENHAFSVLSYKTELYNYSTWEGKPAPVSNNEPDIKISIR